VRVGVSVCKRVFVCVHACHVCTCLCAALCVPVREYVSVCM